MRRGVRDRRRATLAWLQFASGGENLLVATVVEMRADGEGSWLVPTLNGRPRIRKPPLPAWVSAAATPPSLIRELSIAPVGEDRDRAYERFAYALRLPAVLMSCLIVLLIYEIGRTLRDEQLGLAAAAVAASSLILLRQGRSISSDVHLALWVTVTNLALLKYLVRRPAWRWLPLAGVGLALAILSKGPVAIVQSLVPTLLCAPFVKRDDATGDRESGAKSPGLIAALLCVAIAAPWFAYVASTTPDVARVWWSEVTRSGATNLRADPFFKYLVVFPLMAPWTVLLIVGLAICWGFHRRRLDGLWPMMALAVPLVVMSLAKDKNERYLLPMLAPAAVAAAQAVLPLLTPVALMNRTERGVAFAHWGLLLLMCVGVPVAGALPQVSPDGHPWWGWGFAVAAAIGLAVVWLAAAWASRRRPAMFVPATMLIMFLVHVAFVYGYRDSPGGRSEMKEVADAIAAGRPAATVWYYDPRPSPKPMPQDLQIYLNRVVRIATSPDQLPPAAGDRVLVMLRRKDEPEPAVAGWEELARRPWGERSWHALEPAAGGGRGER